LADTNLIVFCAKAPRYAQISNRLRILPGISRKHPRVAEEGAGLHSFGSGLHPRREASGPMLPGLPPVWA
jgi:hypothetical protein